MKSLDIFLSMIEYGFKIVLGITLIDFLPIEGLNIISSFDENIKYIFIALGLISIGISIYFKIKNGKLEHQNKGLENDIKKERLSREENTTEHEKLLNNKK